MTKCPESIFVTPRTRFTHGFPDRSHPVAAWFRPRRNTHNRRTLSLSAPIHRCKHVSRCNYNIRYPCGARSDIAYSNPRCHARLERSPYRFSDIRCCFVESPSERTHDIVPMFSVHAKRWFHAVHMYRVRMAGRLPDTVCENSSTTDSRVPCPPLWAHAVNDLCARVITIREQREYDYYVRPKRQFVVEGRQSRRVQVEQSKTWVQQPGASILRTFSGGTKTI